MKPIHIKRLRKLIAFLRKLPEEKFAFYKEFEKSPKQKCPTIGCAIGWTPAVFPKLVSWFGKSGSFSRKGMRLSYCEVAKELFGISEDIAANLFYPEEQHYVDTRLPDCGSDATPKQVARMLEKFIKLQTEK